ncbi:MAG TPA: amino acid adenylation domain-containing protein, partial [Pyrinomonadaceae bacterium]|nr:amino acid adenylation domain-containing protein [Pyrinomonadaceae bacterium]
MSNIAKRIAELSPERRELFARLLKQEQQDVSRTVITPRPRELKHVPLSFAQQRLWFLQQLKPDSPFYNIPEATYFDGPLDISALERSFTEIVRRHEALRTTFQTIYGQPVQVIAPPAAARLEVVDLSRLPQPEREPEAQRLALEEAQKPFDLSSDKLLRLRLLKLDETKHILLVTMHHIVSDGWSLDVLTRELNALYAAFREGKSSPLAELPVQYADYAVWQREWLSGEVLAEQLGYWRGQLGGELPTLELPTDRVRPAVQTYHGAVEIRELDERLARKLNELGRQSGATLFMTLLAAFNVLLARYSGQEEILVGTPIAGRNRAEIENLIGFVVNTLALRTDLSGNPGFREILARTRETTLGAYAHQDVPFERLVEELQPSRSLSLAPLFQVVFTVQNQQAGHLSLHGTEMEAMQTETETSKFDLRLAAIETENSLTLSMRYSTELFDAARIQRMLEHFECLLESIVADPSARLSELSILSERERRRLLTNWQADSKGFTAHQCLHELFTAQARKTPDAVAVVCEQERFTYRELEGSANRLAHRLQSSGVGPEVPVGICAHRSPDMIVGVLAVLKAGGAYLPLEPEQPAERLAFMLADSRVRVLLTERSLTEKFEGKAVEVVCLDDALAPDGDGSEDAPTCAAGPDNLAYVIYTSGSTGQPKGTQVTHRNVVRLLSATRDWFDFDGRDVWTLFHSFAFDFSVWELWGALLSGGRLVIVPYLISRSPEQFYELLLAERVTVLNQTPSAFGQLMRVDEHRRDARSLSLRLVIFGGEALEFSSLKGWVERHGDERPQLVNMYGITETTVHVTYRPLVSSDTTLAGSGSRVGRPIPDLEIYVLDRHLNPVPFGIPGEMYVGGAGVARGYLNRAGLTAERFVPHPFSERAGQRLYKTGDLVRLLADGDIEYLGRIDQQVKIRGFRIELGEIEKALAGHPSVGACVVIAREDEPGDKRLTAYLVGRQQPVPNVNELRDFLGRHLPEHMIPAAFVWLDALPLTTNGKIDRRALPAPGQARPALERSYLAPRDTLEAALAEMWRELLGIEQVGVEDDFFGLGGDSIKGAIFINRLQERLGEIVHVITIFQSPT